MTEIEKSERRELTVERSTSTAHRLLHYDGACGNVHGHNLDWDIELVVSMEYAGEDNMPLDFKEVSDKIDETDHTTILNIEDPLLNHRELLGDKEVIVMDGDPTCEVLAQWMASRLVREVDAVLCAEVTLKETEKYGMTAKASAGDYVPEDQTTLTEAGEDAE